MGALGLSEGLSVCWCAEIDACAETRPLMQRLIPAIQGLCVGNLAAKAAGHCQALSADWMPVIVSNMATF